MNLSVRHWAIISVLAAALIAIAMGLAGGGGGGGAPGDSAPEFDQVAWCRNANAIDVWGSILDGSAGGDDAEDITNLRRALDDARLVAPVDLRIDLARLTDLVLLIDVGLGNGLDLEAALAAAQIQTDPVRVAEATSRLSAALVECGHAPLA